MLLRYPLSSEGRFQKATVITEKNALNFNKVFCLIVFNPLMESKMTKVKPKENRWRQAALYAGIDWNALDGEKVAVALDRLEFLTEKLDVDATSQTEQASIFDAERFAK